MTRLICDASLSLSLASHPNFVALVKLLNPHVSLPTPDSIKTKYIPQEEKRLRAKVMAHLAKAKAIVLIPDGSQDSASDPITHIVGVPEDKIPLLVEIVNHTTEEHTAKLMTEMVESTIDDIRASGGKVVGVLSDNENKMKTFRKNIAISKQLLGTPGIFGLFLSVHLFR